MLSNRFTLTKRHLGILLLLGGALGLGAVLAVDLLNKGREGGIGPAQQLALALAALAIVIGLTLIPLGDQPV